LDNEDAEVLKPNKGSFNKSILILHLPIDNIQESQTLLENILKACKISIDDVYTFQVTKNSDVIPLLNFYQPEIILNFGVPIANENMMHTASFYLVNQFKNGVLLYSDPLHQIGKQPELKTKLWNSLQKLFKLNS
jgi:DNA polymerase III psi subunit